MQTFSFYLQCITALVMYSSLSLAFPAHETFVTKVILGDDYLAGLSDLSTSTQREVDDKEISAKAG